MCGYKRFVGRLLQLAIVLLLVSWTAIKAQDVQKINDLYYRAKESFNKGDIDTARGYINEAMNLSSGNVAEHPGVYVLSGYMYMKAGECKSSLSNIDFTLHNFDEIFLRVGSGEIDPEKKFGSSMWEGIQENYYVLNLISAYCNYQINVHSEAKERFLLIEKNWNSKFGLSEMVRLGHSFQSLGDVKNAIKYYKKSFIAAEQEKDNVTPASESKIKRVVESTSYNMAIAFQQQNNTDEATIYIRKLLSEADDPLYWSNKMRSDQDYEILLRNSKIKNIIKRYEQNKKE